jgi:hypothetical protein
MSHKTFVLSAIGVALLVPGLVFGLIESGPSFPAQAAHAAATPTRSAANEVLAPLKKAPQLLQVDPMVIGAHAAVRHARPARSPAPRREPACSPTWRSLSQGPIGRHVRNLCTPGR